MAPRLPVPTVITQIFSRKPTERNQWMISPQSTSPPLQPHVCSEMPCAVERVLQTTELLENILTFIPARQVLPLQQINKKWRAVIRESPSLRLHRFLRPLWQHPSADFELLPTVIPGLSIRRADPVHLGQWIEIRMSLEAALSISPQRRKRPRELAPSSDIRFEQHWTTQEEATSFLQPHPSKLSISQPPLTNMQAFIVSSSEKVSPSLEGNSKETSNDDGPVSNKIPTAHTKIACDAGITLGFVADVAKRLLRKSEFSLDNEYREGEQVVFKSIISFCSQSDAAPRKRGNNRWLSTIE